MKHTITLLFASAFGVPAAAQPATPTQPGQLTAFYANCLASGGQASYLIVDGLPNSNKKIIFQSSERRLVTVMVSPDALAEISVTGFDGTAAIKPVNLRRGDAVTVAATTVELVHTIKRAELCVRVEHRTRNS